MLASVHAARAQTIANFGFESPALAANSFQYLPAGATWTMAGEAGIARNGSAFGNSNAPQGNQVLILQRLGTADQTVQIQTAGCYTLKFKSAQRPGNNQTFKVMIDGAIIDYVRPTGSSFTENVLPDIFLPAGNRLLKFVGVNPLTGDNTAFVDDVTLVKNPTVQTVTNPGFETPVLANNAFQYNPVGSGWTFSSNSGIARNGSGFGNVTAVEGSQVLLLQSTGSAERSVNFTTAGTYRIALKAAQRTTQHQSIKISLNGTVIDVITPPNRFFTDYITADVTVAAGNRILRLEGTNPLGTDNTAFVDAIAIEKVSAPQNWSSAATWPGGTVPAVGAAVVIPPGKRCCWIKISMWIPS
ncbi:MAG: hypothetical protein HC845_13215 [Akkermansiaceae bacterium]|nr:hypothetical protein [Akkermansiaceae bacterium]